MFLQLPPNPAYRFKHFGQKRGLHPRPPVGTHLKQPSSKRILYGFIKVVAPIPKSTKSAYVYFKEQICLGLRPFPFFSLFLEVRSHTVLFPAWDTNSWAPFSLPIPLHGETKGGGQPSNNGTTAPIVRTWHSGPAQVSGKPVFSSAEYLMTWGNVRRLDHLLPFLNFLFAIPTLLIQLIFI